MEVKGIGSFQVPVWSGRREPDATGNQHQLEMKVSLSLTSPISAKNRTLVKKCFVKNRKKGVSVIHNRLSSTPGKKKKSHFLNAFIGNRPFFKGSVIRYSFSCVKYLFNVDLNVSRVILKKNFYRTKF